MLKFGEIDHIINYEKRKLNTKHYHYQDWNLQSSRIKIYRYAHSDSLFHLKQGCNF